MVTINQLRHPKETGYFTVMAIVGGLFWLVSLPFVLTLGVFALPFLILFALIAWTVSLYQKAVLYGTAVKVSEKQFPELYEVVQEQVKKLGMTSLPDVFVLNGNGLINALAQKTLARRYVMLYGDLVDLMVRNDKLDELKMIIGHELGHHAAGHVSFWKNLLIAPARIIPFISGAYGRSCELTADRIGYHLTQSPIASKNALLVLALGSKSLASKTNVQAFKDQEHDIPQILSFFHELYSTHPRLTTRIIEIEGFSSYSEFFNSGRQNHTVSEPGYQSQEPVRAAVKIDSSDI